MPVYNTATLLADLQQKTEIMLNKAIGEWQMKSPKLLLRQPLPGAWSAAQCLEHLNSYGNYYLPQIENAIKNAKAHQQQPAARFSAGMLGNYFTNLMLPAADGGKLKKMSAPKNHQPAAELNSDKVLAEFISQQERLLLLMESARAIDLNKARVPISIAKFIKLKLGDVFMFLVAHNQRHIAQAERALRQSAPVPVANVKG